MREWILFIVVRLVNALLVRTYFNPDEHWQALEVAHRIVFGYGHLTWEWSHGLRSYIHPLIFAGMYKLLHFLRLDTPWFMVKAPRLFQAIFAAAGDVYLWKLSRRLYGDHVAKWTIFCQLSNWFTFFCMVRTLSSSLETVLTTAGIYYWAIPTGEKKKLGLLTTRQLALSIAWLSVAVRPTSAVIWIYVGLYHLHRCRDKLWYVLGEVLPIGFLVLASSLLIDRWMYGSWVIVPLNFLRFNFLSAGGDFYGTHPWHWYLTQGFPAMVFTHLPLVLAGIWWSRQWFLAGLVSWILFAYSLLGHKEFRFVLPALPLSMIFSGFALASRRIPAEKARLLVLGLVLTNVPVALYTSLVHQRGSEAVMEYLAGEAAEGRVTSITFLTQCHATPFYSTLHADIPMRFLDCSPSNEENYRDESSRFMDNPVGALSKMYEAGSEALPSHFVLFDSLETKLHPFLWQHSYHLEKRLFHSHFPVDRELQAHVLIYSR